MDIDDLRPSIEVIRKYILKKYHLHCAVVVTTDRAMVVEVKESIPLSCKCEKEENK